LSNQGGIEGFYGRNYALAQVRTFQTMRLGETASTVPLVLPQIEWNGTVDSALFGGTWATNLFSINLDYPNGKKDRRAFVNVGWTRHLVAPFGQILTVHGTILGRFYEFIDRNASQSINGTLRHARIAPEGSLYWRWPWVFVGSPQEIFVLEPLLGLVSNATLSTEDQAFFQKTESGALFQELTEWNFWRLHRAPQGCGSETGGRLVYGLGGRLYADGGVLARATIGQSYMLTRNHSVVPQESGLYERRSHIVGAAEVFPGNASLLIRGKYSPYAHRFTQLESKLSFVAAGINATLQVFDIDQYNARAAYRRIKGGTLSLSGSIPRLPVWSWVGSGTIVGDKLRLLNRSISVAYKGDVFSWTNTVAHLFQENYVKRYIATTYQDECFTMTLQAAHVFDDRFVRPHKNQKDTQFTITINFKNLGEFNSSRLETWIDDLAQLQQEEMFNP
ncbi:MAG: hypothetical protein LBQ26_01245, partial [Holosporales bacterium]|jgi:hypothetical protein|nr:hypothetical protein [Holosporales bacterium]